MRCALGRFLTCFVLHFYLLASRARIDDEYFSYDTYLQTSTLIGTFVARKGGISLLKVLLAGCFEKVTF